MFFLSLATITPSANSASGGIREGVPQLIVIVLYLSLLLLLGWFSSRMFRGTRTDYQAASHSIGPFLLLMSIFGTTMTAFALVGSTGQAYREGIGVYGMMASSSGIVHSLCFFLIGVKVWHIARRYHYTTQVEFFRNRLDSGLVGLLLFPILVAMVIPYLLVGVISSGVVVQSLTAGLAPELAWFQVFDGQGNPDPRVHGGVPAWLGSLVICCVVSVYVFFGGMRGTAWANAFQTLVFMIFGVITFVLIANKLGQQDNFLANLQTLGNSIPDAHASRSQMSHTIFLSYLLIPLSVGMFPHVFQHWMTARGARTFQLPVIMHPIFIMIVWVPCVLVGAWAQGNLIPDSPPKPPVSEANAILPFLVRTLTTPLVGGFLAAGILAAIMSSLDSQFLCLGTMFNNDIVHYYAGENRFTDRQQVLITRGFIVAIVTVTYLLGLWLGPKSNVFALGIWCFSGFTALFPIIVAALYWRRLTAVGAIAGIVAAMFVWGILIYYAKASGNLQAYSVAIPVGGSTYLVKPVVPMLLSSTIAMVVVSLVTRPPADSILRKFFPSDPGKTRSA